MGSGEAKELICMTHGHELSGEQGMLVGGMVQGRGELRGGKKWDNCNSKSIKYIKKRTRTQIYRTLFPEMIQSPFSLSEIKQTGKFINVWKLSNTL